MARQVLEQLELTECQFNQRPALCNPAADRIEQERPHGELLLDRLTAAQSGSYAREELRECEGFDDIVVCPGIETSDAIGHRIARSQNDDRHFDELSSKGGHDLQAVPARKPQVQENQV